VHAYPKPRPVLENETSFLPFFLDGQVLPGVVLGQVREETCPAKVQRELRLRLHQQHPRHGEERHPARRHGEQRHRLLVRISDFIK